MFFRSSRVSISVLPINRECKIVELSHACRASDKRKSALSRSHFRGSLGFLSAPMLIQLKMHSRPNEKPDNDNNHSQGQAKKDTLYS